jgi:tetratricopeptide (TPR) repeat protein
VGESFPAARSPDDQRTRDELSTPSGRDRPVASGAPDARYDVSDEISRGGMGRVRVAHDRTLDRIVAVKELLHDTPVARLRFDREVKITARLQHPAIIPIYDAMQADGAAPSYSMRLVAGRSLDVWIGEAKSLEARLALLPNVIAVADAIAYAHSKSIIHRDLKPHNVLIGDFGETVVIDWGIAKDLTLADDELDGEAADDPDRPLRVTMTGAVLGTPVYMAPEQARGARVDERADVYALGAILYHVLVARPPESGGRTDAVPGRAAVEPRVALPRGVPRDLVAVVNQAMARDPAARYPSARELAADLHRFQTGQLVSARRYSAGTLARRFVRRHRAAVVAGALVIGALAIGSAVSVRRIQDERDVADTRLVAAEDIMQFMVSDLRDRLEPLGKLDMLEGIGDRVDRYYRTIDAADHPEGEAGRNELARRIEARRLVGDVKWAKGDSDGALVAYQERVALAHRLGREDLVAAAECSIGYILADRGDAAGALAAYTRALGAATASGDLPSLANAQMRLGDAARGKNDLERAQTAYELALVSARSAVAAEPSDVVRRLRVGELQNKLGDVLQARGDVVGALAQFRGGRDELLVVATQHPERTQALRSLSVADSWIGDLLHRQGDPRGALAAFRQSQALAKTLAGREPLNQEWQRDVAIDHQTIADVLQEIGDRTAAAAELREALAIHERHAAIDPSSVGAQSDVAYVVAAQARLCEDPACAARGYRRAVELYRAVEARDPDNAEYAFYRIADELELAKRLHVLRDPGALAMAREAVASAAAWTRTAPADADGPVLVAHGKLVVAEIIARTPGDAAESRRLAGEALASYRAVSMDTLRGQFFAGTADELALAESLARGR